MKTTTTSPPCDTWSWHCTPWEKQFLARVNSATSIIRIACPFIKLRNVRLILASLTRHQETALRLEVLTRLNLRDCQNGVHDLSALRLLYENPLGKRCAIQVRIANRLHAKLFVFDDREVIVTSSNLTYSGFNRNLEVALCTLDPLMVSEALEYFRAVYSSAIPLSEDRMSEVRRGLRASFVASATAEIYGPEEVQEPPEEPEDVSDVKLDAGAVEQVEEWVSQDVERDLAEGFVLLDAVDSEAMPQTGKSEKEFYEEMQQRFVSAFGAPPPAWEDLSAIFVHRSLKGAPFLVPVDLDLAERYRQLGLEAYGVALVELVFAKASPLKPANTYRKKCNFISGSGHLGRRLNAWGFGRAWISRSLAADSSGHTRVMGEVSYRLVGYLYRTRPWKELLTRLRELLALEEEFPFESYSSFIYKSVLQSQTQSLYGEEVRYSVLSKQGPDHEARFTVEAWAGGRKLGAGSGDSKACAETNAAHDALRGLQVAHSAATPCPDFEVMDRRLVSLCRTDGAKMLTALVGAPLSERYDLAVLVPHGQRRYKTTAIGEHLAAVGGEVRRLLAVRYYERQSTEAVDIAAQVHRANRTARVAKVMMGTPLGAWLRQLNRLWEFSELSLANAPVIMTNALLGALLIERGAESCHCMEKVLFGGADGAEVKQMPAKSRLQQAVQAVLKERVLITYEAKALHQATKGHEARWHVTVWLGEKELACAVASRKKVAEEMASEKALAHPMFEEILGQFRCDPQ